MLDPEDSDAATGPGDPCSLSERPADMLLISFTIEDRSATIRIGSSGSGVPPEVRLHLLKQRPQNVYERRQQVIVWNIVVVWRVPHYVIDGVIGHGQKRHIG